VVEIEWVDPKATIRLDYPGCLMSRYLESSPTNSGPKISDSLSYRPSSWRGVTHPIEAMECNKAGATNNNECASIVHVGAFTEIENPPSSGSARIIIL
jgi:hypothetical protein